MKTLLIDPSNTTYQRNILSQFRKETKKSIDIEPNMDTSTISDIISDKLIAIVKQGLNKK